MLGLICLAAFLPFASAETPPPKPLPDDPIAFAEAMEKRQNMEVWSLRKLSVDEARKFTKPNKEAFLHPKFKKARKNYSLARRNEIIEASNVITDEDLLWATVRAASDAVLGKNDSWIATLKDGKRSFSRREIADTDDRGVKALQECQRLLPRLDSDEVRERWSRAESVVSWVLDEVARLDPDNAKKWQGHKVDITRQQFKKGQEALCREVEASRALVKDFAAYVQRKRWDRE